MLPTNNYSYCAQPLHPPLHTPASVNTEQTMASASASASIGSTQGVLFGRRRMPSGINLHISNVVGTNEFGKRWQESNVPASLPWFETALRVLQTEIAQKSGVALKQSNMGKGTYDFQAECIYVDPTHPINLQARAVFSAAGQLVQLTLEHEHFGYFSFDESTGYHYSQNLPIKELKITTDFSKQRHNLKYVDKFLYDLCGMTIKGLKREIATTHGVTPEWKDTGQKTYAFTLEYDFSGRDGNSYLDSVEVQAVFSDAKEMTSLNLNHKDFGQLSLDGVTGFHSSKGIRLNDGNTDQWLPNHIFEEIKRRYQGTGHFFSLSQAAGLANLLNSDPSLAVLFNADDKENFHFTSHMAAVIIRHVNPHAAKVAAKSIFY